MDPAHEEEIARRLAEGDTAALHQIYQEFAPRVLRLCLRMLGDQAGAEDACHDVFVRAYEKAGTYKRRSSLYTWLYRIAVNHCLNVLNSRKLGTLTEPDTIRARSTVETSWELLGKLEPHFRACLVLREIEGFSYGEIAEVLGLPPGTVMSRLSRAWEKLADIVRREKA